MERSSSYIKIDIKDGEGCEEYPFFINHDINYIGYLSCHSFFTQDPRAKNKFMAVKSSLSTIENKQSIEKSYNILGTFFGRKNPFFSQTSGAIKCGINNGCSKIYVHVDDENNNLLKVNGIVLIEVNNYHKTY